MNNYKEMRELRRQRGLRFDALQARGMTLQEIAEQEGISRERVRQLLKRVNGKGSRRLDYVRAQVLEAYKTTSHLKMIDLEQMFGISAGVISQWLRKAGFSTELPRLTIAEKKERARAQRKRWRKNLDPTRIPHGTSGGYLNWGCRCAACSQATHEAYIQSRDRARALFREQGLPAGKKHGTATAYGYYGCRCTVCREGAHSRHVIRYRGRHNLGSA